MKDLVTIGINGKLRLTLKDADTGKVLQVEEGDNLVLNTGIEDLCYLLSGNIIIPSDVPEGMAVSQTEGALPHVPAWAQFGVNPRGTTPAATDKSDFTNGTLDDNVKTPSSASEIVKVNPYFSSNSVITLQFSLPPSIGNGPRGTGMTYREAVLLTYLSVLPPKYRFFARKTFADINKTPMTVLEAEWSFQFIPTQSQTNFITGVYGEGSLIV